MQSFLVSLVIARAIKNLWRNEIRKSKGNDKRIYEICLPLTQNYLNWALSLNTLKENKNNEQKLFWKQIVSEIIKMIGLGIISREKQSELKNILRSPSTIQDINIAWVIIRNCQMSGISLSSTSVLCLNEKLNFTFSRADICGFVPLIKCPPILDYYTGLHYLTVGRNEKQLGSKLAAMKFAYQKLDNVISYDFPLVAAYHGEALFEACKLNHDLLKIIAWDELFSIFTTKFVDSGARVGTKEYIDCVLVAIWQIFSNQNVTITNEDLNIPVTRYIDFNSTDIWQLYFQCFDDNQRTWANNHILSVLTRQARYSMKVNEMIKKKPDRKEFIEKQNLFQIMDASLL